MLIFLLFQILFASQVTIKPQIVNVQSEFTIEYKPSQLFAQSIAKNKPYLTAYFYEREETLPYAIEFQGEQVGDIFKYYVRVDSVYNFVMFKFTDGVIDDNNQQQFWDVIIHKYDKPVKGAHLKKALTYLGNMPPNINRLPDLKIAENNIKKELELFPDDIVAQIANVQVRFDQGFLKEDAYKDELKNVLNKEVDLKIENNVRAVSRALKTIGLSDKANQIELDFGKKYSKSELAQELIMAKLSEAEDLKSFVSMCEFYLKNYEDSPQKERVMLALVSAYLQNGNYYPLMKKLEEFDFIYPTVYSKIAMELSELSRTRSGLTGMDLKREVINNYKKSITLIDSLISSESKKGKPRYFSKTEQLIYNYLLSGTLRQGLGEFYLEMRELDSAEYYLRNALLKLEDKAETTLYLSLIELNKLNTNTKEIFKIAERAIIESRYNDTIINIYTSLKGISTIDSLFEIGQQKRIDRLKFEEIDYKTFSGLFKTTEDLYKDIESDTSTYKIVTFFSTWCGPCQAMVPSLEELEATIKDSINPLPVDLYSINAWENPKNRDQLVAEFLDEFEPKYTILIDETSIIPQKYGVTGLPITFILDKESKIKFRIEGFDSQADFVRKCIDRIKFLENKNEVTTSIE
jgi:thiol-disulfide isomerase/thioredoxin